VSTPRERFHLRAAEHAAALPPEAAIGWLGVHGLHCLAGHPALPEPLRAALADDVRRVLATNLYAIARFQELCAALEGLDVCPLKGICLLDSVYRDHPGERRLGDLDLLVRPGAVEEALARLRPLGFAEGAGSAAAAAAGAPERVLGDGRLVVEIHDRLGIKHGRRSTWEDLEPVAGRVHAREVFVLDDETTLVHLVTHFVKHGPFVELRWAEDALRWAERGVDGARAVARARRLGGARSLVAGVRLLRALAAPELLPGVPEDLPGVAGAALRAHERWVWRGLRADPFAGRGHTSPLRRNLSALLLADRPADAVAFLAAKRRELASRRDATVG